MINWSAFGAALTKAARDISANAPPPPKPALTGAQIAAALAELQAELPTWQAALAAHPGLISGADDILDALAAAGVPGASTVEGGVDALPGAVSEAREWLPWILPWLGGAVAGTQPLNDNPGSPDSPVGR